MKDARTDPVTMKVFRLARSALWVRDSDGVNSGSGSAGMAITLLAGDGEEAGNCV
jgi:hypothetical protein